LAKTRKWKKRGFFFFFVKPTKKSRESRMVCGGEGLRKIPSELDHLCGANVEYNGRSLSA
jgi:hypothetical protein